MATLKKEQKAAIAYFPGKKEGVLLSTLSKAELEKLSKKKGYGHLFETPKIKK